MKTKVDRIFLLVVGKKKNMKEFEKCMLLLMYHRDYKPLHLPTPNSTNETKIPMEWVRDSGSKKDKSISLRNRPSLTYIILIRLRKIKQKERMKQKKNSRKRNGR